MTTNEKRADGDVLPETSPTRSLGDQSTQAEGRSSVSDLAQLATGLEDTLPITDLDERYELGAVIGRGGMGEVLLARDKRLERPVAIKRILGEGARSTMALRRFLTEARSLAQLNHFNIVQVFDYGRDKQGPFLILEYVAGKSLQDRLKEGPLPAEQAIDLACQLCDGLGAAHERGIIHRDVKPANVLLTERGEPKLTDFGLAHRESGDDGRTQVGAMLGTIDFMPPEQRRDATQADARSDLWSLAATLYQMLTGKSPKVIRLDLVSDVLRPVLVQALEEDPAQRYKSAAEFKEALKAAHLAAANAAAGAKPSPKGTCPQCGTRNELNRKFCSKCAAPISVPCPECGADNPIWEEVCGNCGTRCATKISELRQKYETDLDDAAVLGREYRFDEGVAICLPITEQKNPQLADLRKRALETSRQLTERRDEQIRLRDAVVNEARSAFANHDDKSVFRSLEQIPAAFINDAVRNLRRDAQSRLSELQTLMNEINRRVAAKDLVGLEKLTAKFLELKPEHEQVGTLHRKLLDRAGSQGKSIADKVAAGKPADEVRIKCPTCRSGLQITAVARGKNIPCPACQTLLRVSEDLRTLTPVDPSGESAGDSDSYGLAETRASRNDDFLSDIISQPPPPPLKTLSTPTPIAQPPASGDGRRVSPKLLVAGAAGAGAIVLGIVIWLMTNHGTIQIELTDPQAIVTLKIDGEKVTFKDPKSPITLSAGEHGLEVASPQFETVTKQFTVLRGANTPIQVTLLPKGHDINSAAPPVAAGEFARPMPQTQAVYTLVVDPPTASIDVSGVDATVSGSGANRQITVNSPDGATAMVVAASAPGYATFQRTVVPKSQDRQNLAFKLTPQMATTSQTPSPVAPVVRPDITIALGSDQKIYENNWLDSEAMLSPPVGVQLSQISLEANYGDGSRVHSLTADSAGNFRLRHRFPKTGRYGVTVLATAGDKARGESALEVIVDKRLPLPDDASARQSRQQVRELLPDKFAGAAKPAEKIALCAEILALAEQSKADPPAFFGLCAEAHDLAVDAADVDNLEYCIRQTSSLYDLSFYDAVNASLLKLLGSQSFPSILRKIGDKAVALAADAALDEQFDSAGKLVETARQAAAKSADLELKKSADLAVDSLKARQAAWQASSQAETTLTTKPDDAQACLQVGRYLALYRQDWEQGLPLLSNASDAGLKDLAVLERSNPSDPTTQLKIADGWWELAEKGDAVAAESVKQHAAVWYTKCRASITGITQKRIDQRLGSLPKAASLFTKGRTTKAIYVADESAKGVFLADPEGKTIRRIAETNEARGLAVDSIHKKVYWVNHNVGEIVRAELDGTNVTTIVTGQTNDTSGIAVDPKREKLYWYSRGLIYRSGLDGSNPGEFITSQLSGARCFQAVGVDADAGLLFWISESGEREILYSTRLDGATPQANRVADVGPKTAGAYLALDAVSKTVYVTMSIDVCSICSVGYDGAGLKTLLTMPAGQQPNGIAVDEVNRRLIWGVIDGASRLEMMNLDGSGRRPMASDGLTRLPRGVDVLYEYDGPKGGDSEVSIESGKNTLPQPSESQYFAFRRSKIVTPIDRFAPSTLEAWIRLQVAPAITDPDQNNNVRYIFGSDLPGGGGWSAGVKYKPGELQPIGLVAMDSTHTRIVSPNSPQIDRWTHFAVVFAGQQTRIYLDGKEALNGPARPVVAGEPFVVGQVGLKSTAEMHFFGDMKDIRISKGERYSDSFTPAPTFDSDANTIALYKPNAVKGGVAQDLSGAGNHGQLENVEVKADSTELPVKSTASVDLMPLIDIALHAHSDGVKKVGSSVIIGPQSVLSLPFASSGNYELDFSLVRTDGTDALVGLFPAGSGHFNFGLSQEYGKQHTVMSASHAPGNLQNGQVYQVRLLVTHNDGKADVQVFLNRQRIISTQVPIVPVNTEWAGIQAGWIPGIKSQNATYEIRSMKFRELKP